MSTWAFGTFDSLTPYILKGNAAAMSSVFYDSLLTGTLDEPDGLWLEDELAEVDGRAVLHERFDDAHAGQCAPLEGLRDVDLAAGLEQCGHSTQRLAWVRQE